MHDTTVVTIRIPNSIERCATEYARHHELRSRNAAIRIALEAFFADPRTPEQRTETVEDHDAN